MSEENICPICRKPAQLKAIPPTYKYEVDCNYCGIFSATEEFKMFFPSALADKNGRIDLESIGYNGQACFVHELQGAIREKNLETIKPFFGLKDSEDRKYKIILDLISSVQVPKTPSEKINKLLENLGKKSDGKAGAEIGLLNGFDYPLAYALDTSEFDFIVRSAKDLGYFSYYTDDVNEASGNTFLVILSVKAWEKIQFLNNSVQQSQQGFIACSFDDDHDVFLQAMARGIRKAKDGIFSAMYIKGKHYPETIMAKAFSEIKRSRFIVVDLTKLKDSVFFEAGFAFGKGVEVIFVIHEKYWSELKEFYSKNYNIHRYKDEKHLEELVTTAINERMD